MYLRKLLGKSNIYSALNKTSKRGFSFFKDFNANTLAFRASKYDPSKELENHKPEVFTGETDNLNYQVSKLHNGFTVITEQTSYPSNVHMGILVNVGTRDETGENSGALLAIKNTYLKTLKHTNETINYGMVQMSGGETTMEYDEETMWYHSYCFEYDAIDMFRMLADCAFEPRSFLAANVAIDKNRKFHKLHHHLSHYDPFKNNPQNLLTTAFGYNTLGMPKYGFESNIGNLDAKTLQDFQLQNITPEKCVIVASGVSRHKEFVELVNETLGELNPVREGDYMRQPAKYIGGEYRTFTETPDTNIILGYESVNWTHEDMPAFAILHQLFGSATGFSVGGPGKGMLTRAYTDILRKTYFVNQCETINLHFSDTGLFALNFTGDSAHSREILDLMVQTFEGFRRPIDQVELNRAKNILKRNILQNMSNQGDRLEELAKSFNTFNTVALNQYLTLIDNVTSDHINRAVERLLKGRPTLVVTGNAVNLVPSIADIQTKLR